MGFELAEQLGWELPDAIFYPTGGGTGLIGMWKAFDELEAIGLIGPKRPRMYAVQAEGCAPIVRAFENGDEFAERWENAATVATGIRVPKAVGDFLILRAVRDSGGGGNRRFRAGHPGKPSKTPRETTASCSAPKVAPSSPPGARRSTAAWSARRARAPVQLRQRQQVSAARSVETSEAGGGGAGGTVAVIARSRRRPGNPGAAGLLRYARNDGKGRAKALGP